MSLGATRFSPQSPLEDSFEPRRRHRVAANSNDSGELRRCRCRGCGRQICESSPTTSVVISSGRPWHLRCLAKGAADDISALV